MPPNVVFIPYEEKQHNSLSYQTFHGESLRYLLIDRTLSAKICQLPRKVSESVNFMLKGYVETFKAGHVLSQEEVDKIVAEMGGEEFRERLRNSLPTLDGLTKWIEGISQTAAKKGSKKR